MNEHRFSGRIWFSGGLLTLALLGLGTRLAFLHLGEHDGLIDSVTRNRHIRRTLDVRRGRIFDRAGEESLMALDVPVRDICADPMKIVQENQVVAVASALSDALDLPVDTLAVRLNNPERRFTYVKRFVPRDRAEEIRQLDLPGVFFESASCRFYPQRSMLCHVLGFVNYEGLGSAGLEQTMEKYLRGSPGYLESQVNALRQEVYLLRGQHIPALEGADIQLTIDRNVQYIVEQALDTAMTEQEAKGAWAIVQRVSTGEILAMAGRPAYDLNAFAESTSEERMNRAIGFVYEPGSTFKALTIAAALNEGTITPDTVLSCEHGQWKYGGYWLHDFHPYGDLTVADGLKKSSNILAAKVALTLGDKRFHKYLCDFGVGRKTGLLLPGEEGGILRPPEKWSRIDATRIAMGHGVAVTALQILNAFCTIANKGVLMQPYVVSSVRHRNGAELYHHAPRPLGQPIRPDTAATMCRLLTRVTEQGGTGRRARVENYEVAGKTGTAEKAVNGKYSGSANVASFVGFLPAGAPELGIIVVVDEPRAAHTGGQVAAPYFCRIASEAVRYLDVRPAPLRIGDEAGAAAPLVARRESR